MTDEMHDWSPQTRSWLWRLLLGFSGLPVGWFVGYCIATIEMDYPAGYFVGGPIGIPVGAAIGGVLGYAIDRRGGILRMRFTLAEAFLVIAILAFLIWILATYVLPILTRGI